MFKCAIFMYGIYNCVFINTKYLLSACLYKNFVSKLIAYVRKKTVFKNMEY